MTTLLYYLPHFSLLLTGWLLLDLAGSGLFRTLVRPRARRLWTLAKQGFADPTTLPDLQTYPAPWVKYLSQSGAIFTDSSGHTRLRMKGVIRRQEQTAWHPAECKAFFTLKPMSMVWYADLTWAFLVSIKMTEQYLAQRSWSTRWMLSSFPYHWKQSLLPSPAAQRNGFYTLASAVWQPAWWLHYTLQWAEQDDPLVSLFTCTIDRETLFLKAHFSEHGTLTALSSWSAAWQEWREEVRFSDYREWQEKTLPFQVDILGKTSDGIFFTRAEMLVTDLAIQGDYAWW